jgi:hypothetical protein
MHVPNQGPAADELLQLSAAILRAGVASLVADMLKTVISGVGLKDARKGCYLAEPFQIAVQPKKQKTRAVNSCRVRKPL